MAIAYVGEIGTVTKDPGGTTSVITVGASGVTAGNHIIIVGAMQGTNTVSGVADSGGNTYTVDRQHSSAAISPVAICSAHVGTGLVNGNTITITHSSSVGAWLAEEFSGVASASYVDGVASAGATTTTAISTGSTATLAASTELQICAVARDGSNVIAIGAPQTAGVSNFTTEKLSTGTTVRTVHGRYKIGVGTTAVDYTGTLSSARTHNEATVTYKEAAGGVDATVTAVIADAVGRGELPVPALAVTGQALAAGSAPIPTPALAVTAGALAIGDAPEPTMLVGQPRPFINLTVGA